MDIKTQFKSFFENKEYDKALRGYIDYYNDATDGPDNNLYEELLSVVNKAKPESKEIFITKAILNLNLKNHLEVIVN